MKREKPTLVDMRVNRFVLDNNVWISYFITKQQPVIIDIATRNHINIFACNELLEEFKEVLQYHCLADFSTKEIIPKTKKVYLGTF